MWKPTTYRDEDVAAFKEAMAASPIDAVLIHAVYLLNCASEDPDIRAKSLTSLTHSLRVGHEIGASGVVLHPGSAKTGHVGEAIARAGATIREALTESEGCELHLENTAGTGGTLGRSFDELAALLDASGGGKRLGVCLDSCHLLASGYDIRTRQGHGLDPARGNTQARTRQDPLAAPQRLPDPARLKSRPSRQPRRGRARRGRAAWRSCPRPGLQKLPCVLETPGENREGPGREEIALAMKLRERGIAARKKCSRRSACVVAVRPA